MVSNGVRVAWINSYMFHRFQIWLYQCLCRLSRSKLCYVLVYLERSLSLRQNALCCRSDAYIFHTEYMIHHNSQIWQMMTISHFAQWQDFSTEISSISKFCISLLKYIPIPPYRLFRANT